MFLKEYCIMEYAIKILKENKALLENNKAKNTQEILE